jgi:hypothetical protein
LKLFWERILERPWPDKKIPRTRKRKRLPELLSVQEVTRLIGATKNVKHRYVKRVAISNGRIYGVAKDRVRFCYRDYADGNKKKDMELDAVEFIRRFVQHILPSGFCKVRCYGLLATRNRSTRLMKCHQLLNSSIKRNQPACWETLYEELTGYRPDVYRECGGKVLVVEWLLPPRAPPWPKSISAPPKTKVLHPLAA